MNKFILCPHYTFSSWILSMSGLIKRTITVPYYVNWILTIIPFILSTKNHITQCPKSIKSRSKFLFLVIIIKSTYVKSYKMYNTMGYIVLKDIIVCDTLLCSMPFCFRHESYNCRRHSQFNCLCSWYFILLCKILSNKNKELYQFSRLLPRAC